MKTDAALTGLLGLLAATSVAAKPVEGNPYQTVNTPFGYKSGSKESIQNLKDKVQHVVWILLENRSFDNILGGFNRPGIDNPTTNGPFCNPQNVSDPKSAKWCTKRKNFDSVLNDPDHSVTGNNMEFYGSFSPDNAAIASGQLQPSQQGFVNKQLISYPKLSPTVATEQVMGYYSEDEVPTLADLVDEYTIFNRWFSCVPGPTNPNRLCALAGTAAGHGTNDNSFDDSGIDVKGIFEVADEKGLSWLNYDGTNGAFLPDALFFNWTAKNKPQNVVPLENFYQDAYLGLLPQLSYLNPSCCGVNTNSMHPTGNVSFGQVFVKQIYEAIRNGPLWDKTMLLVTYDETGGFFDHVPAPLAVRPDNLTYTEKAHDGSTYTLNFDRLGGRMPTFLVSPYSPKGYVEQYGIDPATGDAAPYSATSVLKTLGYLWDLEDLTPRVSHSPAFDHLIGPQLRRDTPSTLTTPHVFPQDV
jgi:phospholipase C